MSIDNDPKDYAISYMDDDGFSLTNPMTLKEAMKTLRELRDMDVMCSLEHNVSTFTCAGCGIGIESEFDHIVHMDETGCSGIDPGLLD